VSPDRLTRARWLAARTRNAARHGLLIAAVSCLTTLVAILTFVLVPRQVDRALALALGALPAPRDTQALLLARDTVTVRQRMLELRADSLRRQSAISSPSVTGGDSAAAVITASPSGMPAVSDGDLAVLQQAIARARQAPLVESYRTLVTETVLQQDTRARATLDSIEQVHREREAYAALGGPDARYAALTAQLTRLGERLLTIGNGRLRVASGSPGVGDSTTDTQGVNTERRTAVIDSALDADIRRTIEMGRQADSALNAARLFNRDVASARDVVRNREKLTIPPVAALLASLVLGISVGFSTALAREVRRPKVGDAQELERLTGARVIVHQEQARTPIATGMVPGVSEQMRTRGGQDRTGSDAWPLLHLTLTNIGDVSREVEVLSDQPIVAAAVAIHLAAIAASESRETVLVDLAERGSALRALLPALALQRADATAAMHWDTTRALSLGGETAVDLVRARSAPPVHRQREITARASAQAGAAGDVSVDATLDARGELVSILARYDFAVLVADRQRRSPAPDVTDVVLVARLGATPLAWIGQAQRHVVEQGRRVRAVIMWTGALPLVG